MASEEIDNLTIDQMIVNEEYADALWELENGTEGFERSELILLAIAVQLKDLCGHLKDIREVLENRGDQIVG